MRGPTAVRSVVPRFLVGRGARALLLAWGLGALIVFGADLVERLPELGRLGGGAWAGWVLARQPYLLRELAPVLVALGAALAAGGLVRTGEVEALEAAGWTRQRLARWLAAGVLLAGFGCWLGMECAVAAAWRLQGPRGPAAGGWILLDRGILGVERLEGDRALGVAWVALDPGESPRLHRVDEARWQDGAWRPTRAEAPVPPAPPPAAWLARLRPERAGEAPTGVLLGWGGREARARLHQRLAALLVGLPLASAATVLAVLGWRLGPAAAAPLAALLAGLAAMGVDTGVGAIAHPLTPWVAWIALGGGALVLARREPALPAAQPAGRTSRRAPR